MTLTDPNLIEIRDLCADLADDRTGADCHGLVFHINRWLFVDNRCVGRLFLRTIGRAAAKHRSRTFKLTGRVPVAERIAKAAHKITEETKGTISEG